MSVRDDANIIISSALRACTPDTAVRRALAGRSFGSGRVYLVSIGKAGWEMAHCCAEQLGDRLKAGVVATKYGHSRGDIAHCAIYEGGHPVPDENSFRATSAAMELVKQAEPGDTVIFLISGGGSALFEYPLIPQDDLAALTNELLACGADIVEMNTIRKRLSAVKGGRFAQLCEPASVLSIVLSDVLGDPLDMIASGPAYPDSSTSLQAAQIAEKYHLHLTEQMRKLLALETPKQLGNVETVIIGNVSILCQAAAEACRSLGYRTELLTDRLCCQAREAGSFLSSIAQMNHGSTESLAFIAGGETVVRLTGSGKGGRNQELALSAAEGIAKLENTLIFSVGSDGTDGPTDAAGGIVDGETKSKLEALGSPIYQVMENNDAYTALKAVNGLIITGPTGTNVNDVAVLLIKK